jgi:hypothetical protein
MLGYLKSIRERLSARSGPRYSIPAPLRPYGRKGSSQTSEGGLIDAILSAIPVRNRYFVEFGIGPGPGDLTYANGLEGNCVDLKAAGWNGLFMDGGQHPEHLGVKQEFITDMNINHLLEKYRVSKNFALISIDVDGQEYWIWKALRHRPEIVIVEYNVEHGPDDAVTSQRDPKFVSDGTNYGGASLRAMWKLGREKGYVLLEGNHVNAFFVRQDLVANPDDFSFESFYSFAKIHPDDPQQRIWKRV